MKRCKPGMIWVARWDYMDTCGRADLLLLSRVAPKHIEELDQRLVVCAHGVRHLIGRIPPKDTAQLFDTTRREWWCPECKVWWPRPSWIFNETTWQIVGDSPYCPKCDALLTRSRCIVAETISLK